MILGTIVFVHGTGVRLKDYKRRIKIAREHAYSAGLKAALIECDWGDPPGITCLGLSSLPDLPTEQAALGPARIRERGSLSSPAGDMASPLARIRRCQRPAKTSADRAEAVALARGRNF